VDRSATQDARAFLAREWKKFGTVARELNISMD